MTETPGKWQEWREGWRTVAGGAIGMAIGQATPSLTGVVMGPIVADLGWPRAAIASNILILAVVHLLIAPIAGRLIGRFGVRRYVLVSIVAAAFGQLLIASAGPAVAGWYAVWLLYGVFDLGVGPLVWTSAVALRFDRARGVAMAVALSGSGLALIIFPPLGVKVVELLGWRAVYVAMAFCFVTVLLPIVYWWFHPRDPAAAAPQVDPAAVSASVAAALRTRIFWLLCAIGPLFAVVEGGLLVHLFPALSEGGIRPDSAAVILSALGVALIVGRFSAGILLDFIDARAVLALSIASNLAACLIGIGFNGSIVEGVAMGVLVGFGAGGTTNIFAYIASRSFGLTAYPTIFGVLVGLFAVGFGLGPAVAGYVRDVTSNYGTLFIGGIPVLLTALLLVLGLTAPKRADAGVG